MDRGKVVVGLSGGVDSAVAAALLVEDGYSVVGVTLKLWGPGDGYQACCTEEDIWFAEEACRCLGCPHHVVDVSESFRKVVLEYAWREYARARTPNPCVVCNRDVKFSALFAVADQVGAYWVATGHHARILRDESGRPSLHRGVDRSKDQSYFLHRLLGPHLERVLFPIGRLTKDRVRGLARSLGVASADRKDSQDACFAAAGARGGFPEALRELVGGRAAEGPILDLAGRTIGTHKGLHNFTVGQRRGIGVASQEGRLYVVRLDPARNAVIVGPKQALSSRELLARDVVWADGPVAGEVSAQIRSRHRAAPAVAEPLEDGGARVVFREPQRAVTPGQAVVFYRGDRVVGGGWIEHARGEGLESKDTPVQGP